MRRKSILWVLAIVICGGFALAGKAWSLPRPFWETSTIDQSGTILHVTAPQDVKFSWVRGKGAVTITQDDWTRYTTWVYRDSGTIELTGRPNGFGGFQTAIYTIRTDDPDTVVVMSYRNLPAVK